MKSNKLVGKKAIIISDNDNYTDWLNRRLLITHASNSGNGYDSGLFPEMLCDFKDAETGEFCPFALYEYEFTLIN
jgi:hypothetical protein